MEDYNERRSEQRLRYYWPIWFTRDFSHTLAQGQMVDISSKAAAFTCHADNDCPHPGQPIVARFSVPCYGPDDSFDMTDFTRQGHVNRVDHVNNFLRRIVINFAEPLPFKPGEQANKNKNEENVLEPMAV